MNENGHIAVDDTNHTNKTINNKTKCDRSPLNQAFDCCLLKCFQVTQDTKINFKKEATKPFMSELEQNMPIKELVNNLYDLCVNDGSQYLSSLQT